MKNLYKKIALVQKKLCIENLSITKNKQGYNYKYADLSSILKILNPILNEYGLLVYFEIKENFQLGLIDSESGEEKIFHFNFDFTIDLSKKTTDAQQYGSYMTYYRRYALTSVFNLNVEEDNDGAYIKASQEQINKLLIYSDQERLKKYLDNKKLKIGDLTKEEAKSILEKIYNK